MASTKKTTHTSPKAPAKAAVPAKKKSPSKPAATGRAPAKPDGKPAATLNSNSTLGGSNKLAEAKRVRAILDRLKERFPDAHCELDHQNVYQLLIATVLSAQSTDVAVNKLTPALFARYPDVASLAKADLSDVETLLKAIGMYRQKSKRIVEIAKTLQKDHRGEVPSTMSELVALNGVGRKTANVILGVWFKSPDGVIVDTHVQRIAQRLALTTHTQPEDIEQDLMKQIERSEWDLTSHLLVFLGRRICAAKKPQCEQCPLSKGLCPSAFEAENVGRKKPQTRK